MPQQLLSSQYVPHLLEGCQGLVLLPFDHSLNTEEECMIPGYCGYCK